MQPEIYTLPELNFVGGATQELRFNLKDKDYNDFDATGCSANFAVCDYKRKESTPIFSLTPTFLADENGETDIMLVTIPSTNTKSLYGKYVYQITIIDVLGKIGIPNQGIMNITKNINQDYI